ncbi:MAG: hypothetical protein ABI867_07645 [Kofleriaceae bacterium]
MRSWLVVMVACGNGAEPLAPLRPVEPASPVATVSQTTTNPTVELVARCATEAVRLLGWNPLPDGAHHGNVIRTSIEHGGSTECAPLTVETNTFAFTLAGTKVDWDWGPKDQADATTIHFTFSCTSCKSVETTVELPRRWHCFGWIEMKHHGTICLPDRAACENVRAGHATKTECALHTGHAWCQRGTTTCSDSPWSCLNSPMRTPCEKAP